MFSSAQGMNVRQRVLPNFVSNFFSFGIRISIAVFFIPYLVLHLGTESYGLVPLAVSIVSFLTVITGSFSSAISRELTMSFTKGEPDYANRVFNTALFSSLALVVVLSIPVSLIACNVDDLIMVPLVMEEQAMELFGWVGAAFLLSTVAAPFGAIAVAAHRLDLFNLAFIVENIVRVVVVILIFSLFAFSVGSVGLATFVGVVSALLIQIGLWRKLGPDISIDRRRFDTRILKGISSIGVWVVVGHAGTLLLLSVDLVLVNRIFGVESSGRYALALQWAVVLRMMASAVAGTFMPTMASLSAEGDLTRVFAGIRKAIRSVGFFSALPIGLVCGFGAPLLAVWIGGEYADLAPLLCVLAGGLILNVPLINVFSLALAAGEVRRYGIVTLVLGVVNPMLALLLIKFTSVGMFGVAISSALLLAVRSIVFDIPLVHRVVGRSCKVLYHDLFLAILATALVGVVSGGISRIYTVDSWVALFCWGGGVSIVYLTMTWLFVLEKGEKNLVLKRVHA